MQRLNLGTRNLPMRSLAGIAFLSAACSVGDVNLSGAFLGPSGCLTCAGLIVFPSGRNYLLLNDTLEVSATGGGAAAALTWTADSVVSFDGSPYLTTSIYGGASHVVVRGIQLGSGVVTATAEKLSAGTGIEVVPGDSVGAIPISRCAGYAKFGFCQTTSFSDTVAVGDTATLFARVIDRRYNLIHATVNWSTSDAGVADPIVADGHIRIVVGGRPGVAVITAAAAGINNSFVMTVVPRKP